MAVSLNSNVNFTSYRLPDNVVEKAREQAKAEKTRLLPDFARKKPRPQA